MKKILCILFSILFIVGSVLPVLAENPTSESTVSDISTSSVESDLRTIYNLNIYPKNTLDSDVHIITLLETGFSEKDEFNSPNYGVYLYLYNPSGNSLDGITTVNTSCDFNSEGEPIRFNNLRMIMISHNSNNTLYKFKVSFRKNNVLVKRGSHSVKRIYYISGIQSYGSVNKDYDVGIKYTFQGYEKGLSKGSQDYSTLRLKTEKFTTLHVDVHQMSWLGDGGSELGADYAQQRNSVYFSIPNDIEDKYGKLYSIDYEYYKYRTAPIVLTSVESVFNTVYNNRFNAYFVDSDYPYTLSTTWQSATKTYDDYLFGPNDPYADKIFYRSFCQPSVFYVDNLSDKNKVLVTAEEFQNYFIEYSEQKNDKRVLGKYSSFLFDDVSNFLLYSDDSEHKFIFHVDSNDILEDIPSYSDTHSFLDTFFNFLFSGRGQSSADSVSVIDKLEKSDLYNGLIPKSDSSVADSLYIGENYVDELRDYYNDKSNNSSVYILRYAQSNDYMCQYVDYSNHPEFYYVDQKKVLVVQETVYLAFDIIDFSFKDENGSVTVIPVVSDPTDGFTDIKNTSASFNVIEGFGIGAGKKPTDWFKIIIAIISILCLVIFVILIIRLLKIIFNILGRKKVKVRTDTGGTFKRKKYRSYKKKRLKNERFNYKKRY